MGSSIYDLVHKAYKAITVPDLGESRLLPEQADRFVRQIEQRSVLLGAARRLTMRNDRRNIDRVGFSDRILGAPNPEATEQTNITEPDRATNQLVAEKVRGSAVISDEALEENIERGNFADTLVDMIAERAGLDLEELFLAGGTDAADAFLELVDGWLVKAAQQLTALDFDPADIEDLLDTMLLAVDDKYLREPDRWRYYVTFAMENAYRDTLRGRGTALGDEAQTGRRPLFFKGFRVEHLPLMPAGRALLTNVDNSVYGLRREIEIEPERKPSFDRWDFHVRAKGDAHYEDENAAVAAEGWTG